MPKNMPKELSVESIKIESIMDKKSSRWSPSAHKRLGEGCFILVFALSLFILLALISYNRTDPSWFGYDIHLNAKSIVGNAGGWVGAYLADILLFLLGLLAYSLPFILVYIAWMQFYAEPSEEPKEIPVSNTLRIVGALLVLLGATGIASFELAIPKIISPHAAGGVIGDLFSTGLNYALNPQGTVLVLLALCFTGITLLTGVSWVNAAENIGYHTLFWMEKSVVWTQKLVKSLYNKVRTLKTPTFEKMPLAQKNVVIQKPIYSVKPTTYDEKLVKSVDLQPAPFQKKIVSPKKVVTDGSLPPLSLLEPAEKSSGKGYTGEQLEVMAREVEQRLLDFGVEAQVVAVNPGPVITRFELQLAAGVKVSRISGLAKDLARSLSVVSVRIVDVIPGKPVIGLELPNQYREMVRLSEVFLSEQFQQARSPISMALGVDISGYPVVVDLAKMPHLLVAGTTGSGKSVGLNAMLLSILFKATPEEVRLILVDPKMLEFSIYDRIPHLLTPVVTDMKEAAGALRWSVAEMERRYKLMSLLGVRNLAAYNNLIKEAEQKGESVADPLWKPTQDMQSTAPALSALPYIVVVIDELADMMMVVGKKVEQLIARIAQKARAAGIHLILATQRPSVDVLTGLIKSNIPTRIAFQVSSKIDSRTILDQQGADQLLGHGDMLYLAPGSGAPMRIHGAFVDDREVHRVVEAWRERGDPQYVDVILKMEEGSGNNGGDLFDDPESENVEESDPLYDEAVQFVIETRKASISSVQRRLKIGYNRAARLIEEMERTGVVSPMESNGTREVLTPNRDSDL